jgi:hypothetical protein
MKELRTLKNQKPILLLMIMEMKTLVVHLIRLYHQLLMKYPISRPDFYLMNQEHAKTLL